MTTGDTDFLHGALFTKLLISPGFSVGNHSYAFQAKIGGYTTPLTQSGAFVVTAGPASNCSMVATPNSAPLIPSPTIHVEMFISDSYGNPVPNERLTLRTNSIGTFIDDVVYTNQSGYTDTYYQPEEAGTHIISTLQLGCQTPIDVQSVSDPYDISLLPVLQQCDENSVEYWLKTLVYYKGTEDCASDGILEIQIRDCPTAYFVGTNSQAFTAPLQGSNCEVSDHWPTLRNLDESCEATLAIRVRGYGWHYQTIDFGGGCPPDVDAPAAISDLTSIVTTNNGIQVSWTAPGDDGMEGQVAAYDIRYSSSPIFGESWPSAAPIPQTLTPAPAGTHESFSLAMQSLPAGKYYIAMKAADEVPNWSEISNNAEVLISNSKVSILPLTWYMNWAGTSGTIRAYLGNFPTGLSASNVVASSIRLNESVAIYNGLSRVRPSMAGFTGSVVEIAFDRSAALASITDPLVPGRRYPAVITGQFTNGQPFLAVQEIEVFCNATNLYSCYNFPNSISVTAPAEQDMGVDDNFLISWIDEDIDNSSLITLAYDTDNDVDNGYTEIVSDLSEDTDGEGDTYNWDLTAVPDGSYYVLAIIEDGIEHTNYDYSPGTVRIEREIITPTGVIAYYPFNGNANDASGNGHNGTNDGAMLSTDRFGTPDAAYYFDGSYLDGNGTTISVASSPAFGPDSGIIIDLWIRPTAYPDLVGTGWEYHKGILWTTTESSGFAMWIYADSTIAFAVAPSPWAEVKSQTRVPLNSWTHLRGTYESSTGNIRLFVNDVLEDEIVSNNRVLGEAGLVIGRNPFAWDLNRPCAFEGEIDDIRISTFESSPTPEASYMVYDWYNGSTGQVYRANQDFSQVQQLTHSPYSASMPAISADGRWVVYSQNEADNRANLWIINSSGSGTPRQLTFQSTSPGQRAFMPSWHPNGQKVYYTQEVASGPTIREVSIDGSGDNLVVNPPSYDPVINPANPDQLAYISQGNFGQNGVLHIRSLASGTETTILPDNGAADYHMSFSPDGQYLLWSEQTGGSYQNFSLRRMHLASLTTTTIVEAPGDLNVYGGYSPDGQYVYYSTTHGATLATTEFWRSLADGSEATLLYTQPGTGRGYLGNVGSEPIAQPSGLIAHYLFDGSVNDETGNGFNGVNHGAQFIPDRLGIASHALSFSGAQQSYVEIPNSGPMVLNDLFTIAFWIRQAPGNSAIIMEKDIVGSVDYDWYLEANNGVLHFGFGTWGNVYANRSIGDGGWHHVAYVRNRSTGSMKLYIDGTLDKDDPGHFNNLTTDALIHFGAWDTPGGMEGFFEGALDEIRFYDRVLSAQEISELYGNGGQDPSGEGTELVENWENVSSLPNNNWGVLVESGGATYPFVEDFGNPGKGLNPGGNGHLHSGMAYNKAFQPDYTNGMTVEFDAFLVSSGWHYTDVVVDLNPNPIAWPNSPYVVRMQFNKNYPNVRNVWMSLYSTNPDHEETMVLPAAYNSDAWNHGKFVIRPNQRVEFYVNGSLLWTSTKTIDPAYMTTTSLCILGQSAGGAARVDNINAVNSATSSPGSAKLLENSEESTLPKEYCLRNAYPNPFNPTATISFDLPAAGQVKLEVFNMLGQKVRTLVDGDLSAGTHSIEWNSADDSGKRVASGIYLYRLQAGEFSETKKMVLMK
jgi:Tol biopolymer transport system component